MTKISMYIACDGKEFFDENECMQYEQSHYTPVIETIKAIDFYCTDSKEVITVADLICEPNDFVTAEEFLFHWYNAADYIDVKTDITKYLPYIETEVGVYFPGKQGFYRYSFSDGKWITTYKKD